MEQAKAELVAAGPTGEGVPLDDRYRIRSVRTADEAAVLGMFAQSSPGDIRARCLGAIKNFPSEAAARLSRCDGGQEIALVAEKSRSDGAAEIVGLVHLVDFPDEPGLAEFDIMVRSDVQGQGVGHRLMKAILSRARARGLGALVGYVSGENGAMLAIAGELGFRFERLAAGVVKITSHL